MAVVNVVLGLLLGVAAGLLGGMLGIGGGIILVPGLTLLMGVGQHTAQGVSLGVITAIGVAGSVVHLRQATIKLRAALLVLPTAILFSLLGAFLAAAIQAVILERFFGLLLLAMGFRYILSKKP